MNAARIKFGHRFIEKNKEDAKKADYSHLFSNFLQAIKNNMKESKENRDKIRKEKALLIRSFNKNETKIFGKNINETPKRKFAFKK